MVSGDLRRPSRLEMVSGDLRRPSRLEMVSGDLRRPSRLEMVSAAALYTASLTPLQCRPAIL
jgi:hypothetical protein